MGSSKSRVGPVTFCRSGSRSVSTPSLVEVSGPVLAQGEIRPLVIEFDDGLKPIEQLLASLNSEESAFDFSDELKDFVTDAGLGLLELGGGNTFAERKHDKIEKVLGDG